MPEEDLRHRSRDVTFSAGDALVIRVARKTSSKLTVVATFPDDVLDIRILVERPATSKTHVPGP